MSDRIKSLMKYYRPEIISSLIMLLVSLPLYRAGHITFSDLAIGREADQYLNYVFGVFNEQLGTSNWFNLPRLNWIYLPYLFGKLLGNSGSIFLATLIYFIFLVTAFSFGTLYRRLVNNSKHPLSEIGLIGGCLIYSMNPWVLIRVQHIFLLCGYALVPLAFSWNWFVSRGAWNKTDFHVPLSKEEWRKFLLLSFVYPLVLPGFTLVFTSSSSW